MSQAVLCCREPATLAGAKMPFARILALDFYDGPTSGVLQCAACSSVYRFDMLDWDADHAVRVFRLAPLPPDALDRCIQALAGYSPPPRWPVWVPVDWRLPSKEARVAADRAVQRLLDSAAPAELLVAWEGYAEKVLAARRVLPEELRSVPDWFSTENPAEGRDWFALLEVPRRGKSQAS